MKRRKLQRSRTLRLEPLEIRRNMTFYMPNILPNGPVDDAVVVKVDSTDNQLSPLDNDGYYYPRPWEYGIPVNAAGVVANADGSLVQDRLSPYSVFGNNFSNRLITPKIVSVTTPKHGQARVAEDGRNVIYTPSAGFEGIDQFEYVVDSASTESNKATISVNVVQPLLAVDDWFLSKPFVEPLTLDVLKNDTFNAAEFSSEEARTSWKIVATSTLNSGGTIRIAEDGRSLIYTSATGFDGTELVEYTLEDKAGYRDTATVSILVSQSTDASVIVQPGQLRQQWLEEVIARNQYQFGRGVGQYYFNDNFPMGLDGIGIPLAASSVRNTAADASLASGHTNNQIAGVDEGDIVETDGRYLYVFTRATRAVLPNNASNGIALLWEGFPSVVESSDLVIIDASDPKAPKIVSSLHFTGRLVGQHLAGDRLIILAESYSDSTKTTMTLVDLADRTAPKVVRSTTIEGSYQQSRMIGDKLYLFTQSYLRVPTVELYKSEDGTSKFFETARQFLGRLGDRLYENASLQVTNYDAAGQLIGTSANVLKLEDALSAIRGTGLVQGIFSFDVDSSDNGPFNVDTLASAGYGSTIFVTSSTAYFLDTRWDRLDSNWSGTTSIVSFAFSPVDGSVELAARGDVPGNLLNRFSVGEHNGDLQVFTSVGTEGTRLSILRRDGVSLNVIGSVKDIAPGESIYAARFDGDRAFVVTFRRVDPLFVLDLTVPTDPKIVGELKLPGYSQYLHLIDSTHLLGIGRDADEQSGRFGSLQASLFDISDLSKPTLQSSYQFEGGRSTFSPLLEGAFGLSDHRALGYFATEGALALPLTHYESHWFDGREKDGTTNNPIDLPEVGVLQIDPTSGIKSLGGVQSASQIQRTMLIGGYLYSIAHDRVIVTDLLTPENRHAELLLPTPKVDDGNTTDPTKNDDTKNPDDATKVDTGNTNVNTGNGGGVDTGKPVTRVKRWHNRENPCDVNGDGEVAPIDVLNLINFIKSNGVGKIAELEQPILDRLSIQGASAENVYQVDVNDDGEIAPIDILVIINHMRRSSRGNGEGESTTATSFLPDSRTAAHDFVFSQSVYNDEAPPIEISSEFENRDRRRAR